MSRDAGAEAIGPRMAVHPYVYETRALGQVTTVHLRPGIDLRTHVALQILCSTPMMNPVNADELKTKMVQERLARKMELAFILADAFVKEAMKWDAKDEKPGA